MASSPSDFLVHKGTAESQHQNRAADHKRALDTGSINGFAVLNAGVLRGLGAAEHGGIGDHITAGFGNLSGVVRRHRVPGGVLTGGAADVPGRGGVAGDHTVTLLLGGIAPLHIRQGQAPPAIGDGLGHQGEVRIRQIRIGPGSGHGSGLGGVAVGRDLDRGVVQVQLSGVAVLRDSLNLRVQSLENFLHVIGIAGEGDRLDMGLGVHAHLILPGHIQQIEKHFLGMWSKNVYNAAERAKSAIISSKSSNTLHRTLNFTPSLHQMKKTSDVVFKFLTNRKK